MTTDSSKYPGYPIAPLAGMRASVMEYQGVWNAATNTPILSDATGHKGDMYRVTGAGTQDLGSGDIIFDVGDYAIHNGTVWEKSDTTDAVSSVNGDVGDVAVDHEDCLNKGSNTHAQIDTHVADAAKHREIDDAGSATTDLWSADKIGIDLGLKADKVSGGTTGNLASLDAGGNLVDSTKSPDNVHDQNTDTDLGTLGTKNPPVDADKPVYRDSEAGDALVTSTWTQIKAFFTAHFDTLYPPIIPAIFDAGSIASGTLTLGRADGEVQKVTVTGDFTLAFTWLSGSGWQSLLLIATDIADHTVSYPVGIHWASGSAPEFGASGKELLGFGYDGTTVYGWLV